VAFEDEPPRRLGEGKETDAEDGSPDSIQVRYLPASLGPISFRSSRTLRRSLFVTLRHEAKRPMVCREWTEEESATSQWVIDNETLHTSVSADLR
jgi:hypothetical protein